MLSPHQPGTVIVIGGALKADSQAVWQRIVDEAGGPGSRIAVFPTAAYEPARIASQIVASLNRCGAQAEMVPIAPHLTGVDLQAKLDDPALIARVAASRGVFFSGGAQEYLVDTLQPDGQDTPMLAAIRKVAAAGGVIAGTSAGAAVMSRVMFRDAMDNLAVLRGQWRAGQEYDRGFGFVAPQLLVDQHFLKRGRIGRMLPAMRALGYPLGLGVDENAAVVIRGNLLEVIGGSGAVVVDLRDAVHDAALPMFNLRGARLSYLDHGDRHDLATGQTTPAEHKRREPRIEPGAAGFEPVTRSERYFLDILGEGCFLAAMVQLLHGAFDEVKGLAFRARLGQAEPAGDIGFEFRLHRGPGLMGWRSAARGCEEYTVLGVRLDVIPVRVAEPLFTPLTAEQPHVVQAVAPS